MHFFREKNQGRKRGVWGASFTQPISVNFEGNFERISLLIWKFFIFSDGVYSFSYFGIHFLFSQKKSLFEVLKFHIGTYTDPLFFLSTAF